MIYQNIEDVFYDTDTKEYNEYPCDEAPGILYDENGDLEMVISASSQFTIRKGDDVKIWSPVFYQNPMDPDIKIIYPIKLEKVKDNLLISTRFASEILDVTKCHIIINEWIPNTNPRTNCDHCTNCGHCSW